MWQVFTEAEVRASLVFQLSKLCSLTLKAARLATGGAEWDALVAGSCTLPLLYKRDQVSVGFTLLFSPVYAFLYSFF